MFQLSAFFNAIEWVWIEALWLILLPSILLWLPNQKSKETLFFPHAKRLRMHKAMFKRRLVNIDNNFLLWWVIWCLLCLSLARPIVIGDVVKLPREGRNIMLAVDISGSMREQDMRLNGRRVDRLSMVKAVIDDFIKQREGDKLGLILFGTQAFIQSPLSYDLKTVRTLLQESAIGLAGQSTAIGDAIGIAVKHMQKFAGEKLLILLTDGQNNAGVTHPLSASQYAKNIKMKIHTIGIGRSGFGSSIDIRMLRQIAKEANGASFLVKNTAQLQSIYQKINDVLPTKDENNHFRTTEQYYWVPLLCASMLLIVTLIARLSWQKIHHG